MDLVDRLVATVGVLVCLAGIGALLATLGWQSFIYLKHGYWLSMGFLDGLNWLLGGRDWLTRPQTWQGLHQLLNMPNFGVAACFSLLLVGNGMYASVTDRR